MMAKSLVKLAVTVAGLAWLLGPAAPVAEAGFVLNFTGNTQMSHTSGGTANPNIDGVVSWAVYTTVDSDWTDDFGAAIDAAITALVGPIDTDAKTVFFYQLVNTDPSSSASDDPLDELQVPFYSAAPFTSAGYVNDLVFREDVPSADEPVDTSNPALGTDPASDGVISGNFIDTATPFVSPDTGTANNPGNASLNIGGGLGKFNGFSITTGQFTSVMFMTTASSLPLAYRDGNIRDGTPSASVGQLPVHAPEPSSAILVLAGCLGLAGTRVARRRRSR